jgi:hypothetical protein
MGRKNNRLNHGLVGLNDFTDLKIVKSIKSKKSASFTSSPKIRDKKVKGGCRVLEKNRMPKQNVTKSTICCLKKKRSHEN